MSVLLKGRIVGYNWQIWIDTSDKYFLTFGCETRELCYWKDHELRWAIVCKHVSSNVRFSLFGSRWARNAENHMEREYFHGVIGALCMVADSLIEQRRQKARKKKRP